MKFNFVKYEQYIYIKYDEKFKIKKIKIINMKNI